MPKHIDTTERDKLTRMVRFFATHANNKCWPTAKRWSVKEAKEALNEQSRRAFAEMQGSEE